VSITVGTVCVTCRKWAPSVGDFGYLGEPSLIVSDQIDTGYGEVMPSFEYFYEALRGVGILPYDLHRFWEFLVAHEGHFLFMSAGHERLDQLPPEVAAYRRERAEKKDNSDLMDCRAFEAEREQRVDAGEFVSSIYEMMCTRCGDKHTASTPEVLRAASPLTVSPEAAAIFVERWGVYPDGGWNHRLMGIVDPYETFMEKLVDFVRTHGTHGLRASVLTPAA
jgi:hypothetical protein